MAPTSVKGAVRARMWEDALVAQRAGRVRVTEAIGRTDSVMAEFPEMLYLYDRPNLLDASFTSEAPGLTATPLDLVLDEMVSA
ncbi:hypothetical protein [Kitasatospora sp. NPDC101183]|uniref:hypothetical protein n=1 Tax=Kitasatospora sp. NPDC101183 TaxID=3364100 RepID=UPI0037FA8283